MRYSTADTTALNRDYLQLGQICHELARISLIFLQIRGNLC